MSNGGAPAEKGVESDGTVDRWESSDRVGLRTERLLVHISSEDSSSSGTDKSFQYLNSCGNKWSSGTEMIVEVDVTKNLEHSKVGADRVRQLGLHSTKEPNEGGPGGKAESDSTGLEEDFSLSTLSYSGGTEDRSELRLLLEELWGFPAPPIVEELFASMVLGQEVEASEMVDLLKDQGTSRSRLLMKGVRASLPGTFQGGL